MLHIRTIRLPLHSFDVMGYPDSPLDSYGYDAEAKSNEHPSCQVRKNSVKNLDTAGASENDRESGSTVSQKRPFVGKKGSVDGKLISKD